MQYFEFTAWLHGLVTPAELGQAFGNLRQRNHFATLMSIGLIALLWHAHHAQASNIQNSFWLYSGIAVLAAASAASGSRTGLLQWLLIFSIYWFWSVKNRKFLFFALTAYIVSALALPLLLGAGLQGSGILSRLQESNVTCASRLTLWSNLLHLISQKPLLGWGWGMLDYAHFITLYPTERFCGIVDNAHNLPLQLAVELGIPIAMLICTAVLCLVVYVKPCRVSNPGKQAAWGILAVIGLHSMLEYPLWYAPFQLAALLAILILLSSNSLVISTKPSWSSIALPTITGMLILIATCVVTYDYWRMSQVYLPPASRAKVFQTDTMTKAKASWFFYDLALFAELTTTPLTTQNAASIFDNAVHLLRLSPEPRVIEKVIESATLLNKTDIATAYLLRYKAAFPEEAARWSSRNHR